jgi:hypothetical protein
LILVIFWPWRFAVAKPYMDSSRFASISPHLDWGTTAHVYPAFDLSACARAIMDYSRVGS